MFCLNSPRRNTFVPELEALRGLAAFSVLVEHTFPLTVSMHKGFFDTHPGVQSVLWFLIHCIFCGKAAILLFFTLSGLVLSMQLSQNPLGAGTISGYAIRRFFRIIPVWFTASMIAYLVLVTVDSTSSSSRMLFDTLTFHNQSLDRPLWTIYYEILGSLLVPIMFTLAFRSGALLRWLFVLPLIYVVVFPFPNQDWSYYLIFFYMGVLAWRDGERLFRALPVLVGTSLFLISVIIYGLIPQLWAFGDFPASATTTAQVLPCFIIVAYVANIRVGFASWLLNLPMIKTLGRLSFSLYAFHYIVVEQAWPWVVAHTTFIGEFPLLQSTILFAITAIAMLLIVPFSYRFIEAPSNRLGRWIATLLTGQRQTSIENIEHKTAA